MSVLTNDFNKNLPLSVTEIGVGLSATCTTPVCPNLNLDGDKPSSRI